MDKLRLGALALLSVVVAGPAMAEDITVAAAGPMAPGAACWTSATEARCPAPGEARK